MPVKVTMFFNAGRYSWSESHYLIAATTFQQALTPSALLANSRFALLAEFCNLIGVRLSSVPANRQVYDLPPFDWPGTVSLGTLPAIDPQYEPIFTSLMVNLQAVGGNKNLYLAGVPDAIVSTNPVYNGGYAPTAAFAQALLVYLTLLTSKSGALASWGYRARLPGTMQNVIDVGTQSGYGNNIGVSTAADPGLPDGSEAYTVGFRTINPRVPNLSGAYKVLHVIPPGSGSSAFTTVLNETGNVEADNFLTLGKIGPLTFQYLSYANYGPPKIVRRKRGGSYGAPRGRSRVRR